jgi:iron complex outermembrane receptor protein
MRAAFGRPAGGPRFVPALLFVLLAAAAAAQEAFEVRGVVRSGAGRFLAGAVVEAETGGVSARTDAAGVYRLRLPPGEHVLRVTLAGYEPVTVKVTVSADASAEDAVLAPLYRISEKVVVQAVRAGERTPVTKKDIGPEEIERLDYGQEMPFLVKQAPSITYYSDSGTGAGYSYLFLRGIPQPRLNLTLDGAPLNEPEDSAFYFSNFADLAGALDSIQIQRGVGTSSVGTASYAGSINFASVAIAGERALAAELGGGSFGSGRGSLAYQTGRLGSFGFYGRAAYKQTDGFRDHSGVIQRAFYFGATHLGKRSFFKLFGFAGREQTQLAFLAVEKDVLEDDLRANPLTPEERDRFGQNFVQAQYTRLLGSSSSLAVQGYGNWAGGWYRIWEDPPARTALLEYQLDWRLIGGQLTFNHTRDRVRFDYGLNASDFESDHAQDTVGAGANYANRGFKSEVSTFAKLGYDLGRWHLYGDVQLRHASFRYEGGVELGSVDWTFLNPKGGARFDVSPTLGLYLSVGKATREPARADMLAGEDDASMVYDLRAVKPERVVDFEGGVEYRRPRLSLQANLYAMEFTNEIALTGELSEIGLPLRRNVDRSHRRGLEVDLRWEPSPKVVVTHSANLSRNRILEWTQFYDVYDPGGGYLTSEGRVHSDVSPLLSPGFVSNLGLDWTPASPLTIGVLGRYVSRAFLDNTSNEEFATPHYFNLDASASLSLSRWVRKGQPRIRLQAVNLLDNRRIWPSGYSYLFLTRDPEGGDTPGGIAYYYPQATRAVFVTFDLQF